MQSLNRNQLFIKIQVQRDNFVQLDFPFGIHFDNDSIRVSDCKISNNNCLIIIEGKTETGQEVKLFWGEKQFELLKDITLCNETFTEFQTLKNQIHTDRCVDINKLNTISPEEIVLDNMFSKASLIESGIYSKEQLVQERKRDLLHEYMRDREKPLQEAQSANALKLLELEQIGLLQTYKNYEQSLRDLNTNGYNFQIDQPSVNWKEIFDSAWLKEQILSIFVWPWYILEKMAIIYAMISMILFIANLVIKFFNAFAIHKAIGKQVSITKLLLTGIFGIFSQTLTQLVAQIQEENIDNDSDDNNSHYGNLNNRPRKNKHNFR